MTLDAMFGELADEIRIGVVSELCHPLKPWSNTSSYEDTSTRIDVAEVVDSELRW